VSVLGYIQLNPFNATHKTPCSKYCSFCGFHLPIVIPVK
jgi:hypothetical protein